MDDLFPSDAPKIGAIKWPPRPQDFIPRSPNKCLLVVHLDSAELFHAIRAPGIERVSGHFGHVYITLIKPGESPQTFAYHPQGKVFEFKVRHGRHPLELFAKAADYVTGFGKLVFQDIWKRVEPEIRSEDERHFDKCKIFIITDEQYYGALKSIEMQRQEGLPYQVAALNPKVRNCVRSVSRVLHDIGISSPLLSRIMPWPWTYSLWISMGALSDQIFGRSEREHNFTKPAMKEILEYKRAAHRPEYDIETIHRQYAHT
jgi:hypothetical protein